MRRRIRGALLAALMAVAGALTVVTPANAEPLCDVPDPPSICNEVDDPPATANPDGALTSAKRVPGGVYVTGWATDPDGGSVRVSVRVGTTYVGTVYASSSTGQFAGTVPAVAGSQVCATANNVGGGLSKAIGCVNLTVNVNPVGAIVPPSGMGGYSISLRGWALDPDTTDPIDVQFYSNGVHVATVTANQYYSFLTTTYSAWGSYHGYSVNIPHRSGDGEQTICAYGVNVGAGTNTQLACQTFTIRHAPEGAVDEVTRTGSTVRVRGWAADPDAPTTPTRVVIRVDGVWTREVLADLDRPDVATTYPKYGNAHGFDLTLPVNTTAGTHRVCATAINLSYGTTHTEVGCKTYVTPGAVAAPTVEPITSADDITDTSLRLHWTNNTSNATGLRVERSDAGGAWHEVTPLHPSHTSYRNTGLNPNTRYCYRVVAFNDLYSTTSNEVCANTMLARLPKAGDLTVVGRTDTTLTVRWTDNAEGEDKYWVAYLPVGQTGLATRIDVPAHPGTGGMTHTITGLSSNVEYRLMVVPVKAGHYLSDYDEITAWTSGPPTIASFTSSASQVAACSTTAVTLTWKANGATRIQVKRGSTVIADRTQAAQAEWTGTVDGGSHDGNVTYTITAFSPDGRTATKSTTVARTSAYPLVRDIVYTNTGYYQLEAWFYDLYDNKLQKVGTVAPGGRITITPGHCLYRRIKVIDPNTGRIAFQTSPQIVLGHNEGSVSQVAAG
ncbi:fibronectin type III domain-containing protein [Micromonospora sp. NPDC052213]|uniref:fibronectin type III domain-containing protein n=1 Tax=Micromonospora sp. NPDC052213 TaxID=3155812 RepID=UPI003445B0E4